MRQARSGVYYVLRSAAVRLKGALLSPLPASSQGSRSPSDPVDQPIMRSLIFSFLASALAGVVTAGGPYQLRTDQDPVYHLYLQKQAKSSGNSMFPSPSLHISLLSATLLPSLGDHDCC
jgi:hypothetical protein